MQAQTSAASRISSYFAAGNTLSPLEALSSFGSFRLADVVLKLRKKGRPILTRIKTDPNGKHYAEYRELFVGDRLTMESATANEDYYAEIPQGAVVSVLDPTLRDGYLVVSYLGKDWSVQVEDLGVA